MTTALGELTTQVRARRDLPPTDSRRALRIAAGVSLREIAHVVGVTPQAVGLWERGLARPTAANLLRYAEVLRVLREAGP